MGTSSQPLEGEPVVKGAGFDPAFIPGLTSPVSGEPEDAKPEDAPDAPDAADATDGQESGGEGEKTLAGDSGAGAAPEAADAADDADAGDEAAGEPEGPVFEAADRRARIVADRRGVRLRLDDQECEFRWDEIGAVETETARFGKRFTVTVHTPERRWYPIEIDAPSRSVFPQWEARLDEVLDAYFEDGDADAESAGEPAAEMAGEPAPETAGESAGKSAAESAQKTAGEPAAREAGEPAGESAKTR
ncbi:hypothetical protein DN402_13130 [Streptomyces sp. SW4]|nr:hypothetical protein DN402_13130 [Streptomyces sp. SW4]